MLTNKFVFYFTKNFYLVSEFNNLIYIFESAGLTDYIMSKYVDPNSMQTIHKNPPSALNYNNIEGFFAIFYYRSVLALISFVCEIIFGYLKERKRARRLYTADRRPD